MTFLVAAAVFCLDRLAKFIVTGRMVHGQSVKIWPGVFHITYVLNDGTAFGLFKGYGAVFASFSLFVMAFIVIYILKNRNTGAALSLALGLILGGAAGNFVDRVFFGRVIDFFDFRIWPVFNMADSAITAGSIVLICKFFAQSMKTKKA